MFIFYYNIRQSVSDSVNHLDYYIVTNARGRDRPATALRRIIYIYVRYYVNLKNHWRLSVLV